MTLKTLLAAAGLALLTGCSLENWLGQVLKPQPDPPSHPAPHHPYKPKPKPKKNPTPVELQGSWKIHQQNTDGQIYTGTFRLETWADRDSFHTLRGQADWDNHSDGDIYGSLSGDTLYLVILYRQSLVGHYRAVVSANRDTLKLGISSSNSSGPGASGTWSGIRIASDTVTVPISDSLTGCWRITQPTSDGVLYQGDMAIRSAAPGRPDSLSGRITWDNYNPARLHGSFDGRHIEFLLSYEDGVVGHYRGYLNAWGDSLIDGTTSSNNGGRGTWRAGKGTCLHPEKDF